VSSYIIISVVAVGFLLGLGLVLYTVRRLRPQTFRFKATLTRWVSLDLEMNSPEGTHLPKTTAQGITPETSPIDSRS
jgi:hypothetical protein